jgi:hypothetical protein
MFSLPTTKPLPPLKPSPRNGPPRSKPHPNTWHSVARRAQRDATHQRTRPPVERLISKRPTQRPDDPYPGIQEVSVDEASRLAMETGEVREVEVGVWPNNVRRKGVLVNKVPVELGEIEREREIRKYCCTR